MNNDFDKKQNFGKNITRLRKERGLSQKKLAEITGLSQRVISSYEIGIANPPIDNIEAIAKALQVKINELIDIEGASSSQGEYLQLDSRSMEKIRLILSLPRNERHIIYNIAESFLAKAKLEKQEKLENQK